MKNFIVAFSVFMMWALLGMWYYSCVLKEVCNNEKVEVTQEKQIDIPISENVPEPAKELPENVEEIRILLTADSLSVINDDFQNLFSYPLAPEIRINSAHVEIPQTTSIFLADISKYLEENPQQFLMIYAAYDTNEFSSDGKENLGLTRAAFIKNLFLEKGISPDRMLIDAVAADLNFIQNEVFQGGILLQIKQNIEKSNSAEDEQMNKILYANFDVNTFKSNQEIDDYAIKLKKYLNENPQKIIIVTGHTDDIGEVEANDWIGMERAKSVRAYLISKGFDENKIKTFSKGETAPMVPNTNRENRAKNRRIEIKIE
ncbi:MAG TPA: OmpA family protein [Salinimicrobium sp.]|nr:OmpA family protein [Salinimicrobium sp.]